jgi:hypothetical protein
MPSRCPSAWTSEMRAARLLTVLPGALLAALFVALGSAACGAVAPKPVAAAAQPAPAAVPPAGVPGRPAFDHAAHLGRGLTCLDCHTDAEKADRAGMPTAAQCMECHEGIEEEAPPEKRIESFLDPKTKEPRWSWFTKQPDEVRFSHARHAQGKVACKDCHAGVETSTQVVTGIALTMDACTACHAERKASNACATCHTEIGLDKPPANHGRLWDVRHGQIWRRGAPADRTEDCSLCHTESTCVQCHRDEKPRDHTEHWRVGPGHGLAASLDRERCAACHRTDACVACHTSNPPRSHRGAWGSPRNRHCLGCHERSLSAADGGCGTCHQGTPSHRTAPPKPATHRPDWQCLQCHERLRHPVNDQNCNECHR